MREEVFLLTGRERAAHVVRDDAVSRQAHTHTWLPDVVGKGKGVEVFRVYVGTERYGGGVRGTREDEDNREIG